MWDMMNLTDAKISQPSKEVVMRHSKQGHKLWILYLCGVPFYQMLILNATERQSNLKNFLYITNKEYLLNTETDN
jgi:hypothetical protein